ncbi:FkbM family methyltransferase [Candidatus Babeliales bacterium]|nr:FkbM family methyltransferase [Candidatus Babeliales bacterium]
MQVIEELKHVARTVKKFITRDKWMSKQEIMRYLPSKNITMLEAGAYDGNDTLAWSTLLPNATIHAFEPEPSAHKKLQKKVRGLSNVTIWNQALNDVSGEVSFNVSQNGCDKEGTFSSSLLKPKEHLTACPHIKFEKKITVKAINLDEWVNKNNIGTIDFLWLDMQGAEFKVLQAAPKTLAKVKVIFSEVSLKEMYDGAPLYDQFKNWLETKGFVVKKEELPNEEMGNVLFVRK